MRITHRLVFASLLFFTACTDDASAPTSADDEWGMEGPLEPLPPPGKEDAQNRRGLFVNTNTTRTQVWSAKNAWEDRETPAARAAGLAWDEDSGLSWDEKYAAWVESLAWTPALNGYSMTVELTTPWGKTLPSPYLECAEMALFLRITFAAWHLLPIQLEAISNGRLVYFGHNGVRTQAGRFAESPEFAIKYRDHSTSDWRTNWPVDTTLRTRKLWGGEDEQLVLGEGAVFGAYVDEIHVNKRAGYFTVLALNYLSSVNLADTANMYNLVPDAVRPGDVLVERWQRSGIGHTLVVKDVVELGEGNLDVTMLSGSMPRRQGVRESGIASKQYFTSEYAGGEGANDAGDKYAKLGGGLKRWRVTKNIGGYWTNTWMSDDEAHWINSTDLARIAARPARFQALLGQVSPDQQRTQLLQIIADARHHLSNYPASCAARERREHAFSELYSLSERSFGMTGSDVDAEYRELADYVFAELDYTTSKTCCWNSSTSNMAELVMQLAEADRAADEAAGLCREPVVFRARGDGYNRWADYARSLGRSAEWKAWSEDESCPQRNVLEDRLETTEATPYCSL